MPFIRYSRDKRGNECTFVMHSYRTGQGPQQTRVLYLFRSPANLKIGRKPLEGEVLEALEHTHPDLSFDWSALRREPRVEARQRPARRSTATSRRPAGGRGPAPRPTASRVDPAPAPEPGTGDEGEADETTVDDQTVLGRVVGARQAARLRGAYGDLLQRIGRRARTPEDRDRLIERASRLNPDDWPDEPAAAAGVQSIEAEWDAVAAELPQRRRGRRGGRRREAAGASGIMAEGDAPDATSDDETLDDGPGGGGAGGDDRGAPGAPDAGPAADVPDDD